MEADREAGRVRRMFDGVARRYDLLNHVLSLNLDRRWRRTAARSVAAQDRAGMLVDLCGGTGDLTLEVARQVPDGTVVCCDFSPGMLRQAGAKFRSRRAGERCLLLEADALSLPFADGSVDAVSVAFGVRNFERMDDGLREIHRVLRAGGRLVVLEFSQPTAPILSNAYRFYLSRILPRLGDRVSGRSGPYGYLARTISDFPDAATLAGRIREAGFGACGWETLTGGIVAIHTALK